MAKVIPSAVVAGLIGSIGQLTFQRYNSDINVVKNKITATSQPKSGKQQTFYTLLPVLADLWKTLNTQQRADWETFSKYNNYQSVQTKGGGTRKLIKGNNGHLNGYDSFLSLNLLLASIAQPYNLNAPLSSVKPPPPILFNASWLAGPPGPGVTGDVMMPAVCPANIYTRIWIMTPQQIFHKQILWVMPVAANDNFYGVDLVTGKLGAPVYLHTLPSNTALRLQCDIVSDKGLTSPPSATVDCTIT
jgi:hypothetical protein